jgi:hypothetical protein
MKELFRGYYRPSDDDFVRLLASATIIVVDANVLLNLYRFPHAGREALFRVFEKITDRLWLPHQAALEYQRNQEAVTADQVKKYDEAKAILQTAFSDIRKKLDGSYKEPAPLVKNIEGKTAEFSRQLDEDKGEQPEIHKNVRDRIDRLFVKIGPHPSQEQLDGWFKEGERRYANRIPPGFLDTKKEGEYNFAGRWYKAKYGDLVMWKQTIAHVAAAKITDMLLITDEADEDWWSKRNGQTFGPRLELVDEMLRASGAERFWMYNSNRFVELAAKQLGVPVDEESIEQIKAVTEMSAAQQSSSSDLYYNAERAVYEWLRSEHPQGVNRRADFPDFDVFLSPTETMGWEVKWLGNGSSIYSKMNSAIEQGRYAVGRGLLKSVWIVGVFESQGYVDFWASSLDELYSKLAPNMGITYGFIDPSGDVFHPWRSRGNF